MCGYTNYQDPRLMPPDIDEPDEPMGYRNCVHARACKRIFVREAGTWIYAVPHEDRAKYLDCETCDEWEEV